jgi:hypothetical protein
MHPPTRCPQARRAETKRKPSPGGLGDRFTTSRSARGAALDSSQHVSGIVGYASLFQECQELRLEFLWCSR